MLFLTFIWNFIIFWYFFKRLKTNQHCCVSQYRYHHNWSRLCSGSTGCPVTVYMYTGPGWSHCPYTGLQCCPNYHHHIGWCYFAGLKPHWNIYRTNIVNFQIMLLSKTSIWKCHSYSYVQINIKDFRLSNKSELFVVLVVSLLHRGSVHHLDRNPSCRQTTLAAAGSILSPHTVLHSCLTVWYISKRPEPGNGPASRTVSETCKKKTLSSTYIANI